MKFHRISYLAVFAGISLMPMIRPATVQANARVQAIHNTPGLIALWGFEQTPGGRQSTGIEKLTLDEVGSDTIYRSSEGPITGYSAVLTGQNYFKLPRAETGALNIHGPDAEVTVVAWVKLDRVKGFIAGLWDEGRARRQYGLFVNLPVYGGPQQVCGHVSATGGASEGYPYSKDYSASESKVQANVWTTIGFTYDGTYARSYYNGVMEPRAGGGPDGEDKNPYYYPDGLYDGLGAAGGSDFTIGAVNRSSTSTDWMDHLVDGRLGGVAIYDRALGDQEMADLVFNDHYVPEPTSAMVIGGALGAAALARRRRSASRRG
jgi:hypothetical protein